MSQLDPRLNDGGESKQFTAFARPSHPSDVRSAGPYYHQPQPQSPAVYDQSPSSDHHSSNEHNPDQDDPKRPRACESCRGLKVRCDPDPNNPEASCKRCAKAKRQCIYTQPSRKRQRKADTRVADLEKKLDALTAALQAQHYAQPPPLPPMTTPPTQSPSEHRNSLPPPYLPPTANLPTVSASQPDSYMPNKRRRVETMFPQPPTNPSPSQSSTQLPMADRGLPIDNGRLVRDSKRQQVWPMTKEAQTVLILSITDASMHDRIMDRFVNDCIPTLPCVAFPPGTTASHLLHNRPAVFLAILTTAGFGVLPSDTSNELLDLIIEAIAEVAIRRGTADFDIVQMILILVLWIKAPDKPDRSGFYMTVHLGCTMAVDLGLGKRYRPGRAKKGFLLPSQVPTTEANSLKIGVTAIDSDTIEARRTWLALFYCAAGASTALRRPNLFRWTAYMQECIDILETSPEASPYDALFCQYVRLQKICDDISVCFKMDDPTATAISISDPKVSYQLDIYEQQIKDWERNMPAHLRANKRLEFFAHAAYLYLHEISLHVNHNVDDFQLPFTEEGLQANSSYTEVLTQRQMASMEACLAHAHAAITAFCDFGAEGVAITPTLFYFVRCMYALIVLIKMHLAVTEPGSEVAKIITPEKVQVIEYMERIWTLFKEMESHMTNRPPPKAFRILSMLREWLLLRKNGNISAKEAADAANAKLAQQNSQNQPHRNHFGTNCASSKLQVLSEAATAGQRANGQYTMPQAQSVASSRNDSIPNSNTWTFDSPDSFPRMVKAGSSTHTSDTAPSTPQLPWLSSNDMSLPSNQGMFRGTGMDENADWMAGMDLDQLLDGAFRGFDASGDMGGFLFGDGVGAYQLPTDVTAPTPAPGTGNMKGWQ